MPTLAQIAQFLGVPAPVGADKIAITGVANLKEASPSELSFLGHERYLDQFRASAAGAVLVQRRVKLPADTTRPVLIVDDADLAMGRVLELFAPPIPRPPAGIDPRATISPRSHLGAEVAIGPNVFVGAGAHIGDRTVLHPGVHIGNDTVLGNDCELFPNVVVRERCTLGHRVIIHAGSVVGSDGFGYRWDGTRHAKIPQVGTVLIEDDVEIGSCTCIDRAKFSVTRIGRGTKIDNLVQVGHNVVIGPHCIIVGQVGLAGSATLGAGVVLGGQAAIRDHVKLGDGVMIGACSGVADDVESRQTVTGLPAIPHRQFLREQAAMRRLPELVNQMKRLQEEVAALTKRLEGGE